MKPSPDIAKIVVLAYECRMLANHLERHFGYATTSRSEMLRKAIDLQSKAVRLGNATRAWFDEAATTTKDASAAK